MVAAVERRAVRVPSSGEELEGSMSMPAEPFGVVVSFVIRGEPEQVPLGAELDQADLAGLELNLLTEEETSRDAAARSDVALLARRAMDALDWVAAQDATRGLHIGCLAAGAAVPAVLMAAANRNPLVRAVVLVEGDPESAPLALDRITAPSLLVAGRDAALVEKNRAAVRRLRAAKLELTSEPVRRASGMAVEWFRQALIGRLS